MSDPKYTQGVCMDGAAILKDGIMMTIEEILAELNIRPEYKHDDPSAWQEAKGWYVSDEQETIDDAFRAAREMKEKGE